MSEFTAAEWKKIRAEMARAPRTYGLPARIDDSAVVASFNVRKLGKLRQPGDDSGRDATTMGFLRDVCKHFDLLAIQEVLEDLSAVRELKRLMGKKYGLVVSDTTGNFPGDPGNTERMAFIYNTDLVQRAELVTDLTYDRTEVLRRLYDSRAKIMKALDAYNAKLKAGKKAKIKMPEFLAFIRTPFAAEFKIGPHDFVAINAHLHFGDYVSDRRLEGKALVEWIVGKVRATDSLNAVLFGDLNLDFDNPKGDLKRIIDVSKEIRAKAPPGEKRVRMSFPFLFPHPKPSQPVPADSKIFRTNVLLTETYDQIAIFSQDERLGDRLESRPTGHVNKDAWRRSKKGPDYGVFNFTDLFSKALTGKRYQALKAANPEAAKELIKKFDFNVSDHMPIWFRMPLK